MVQGAEHGAPLRHRPWSKDQKANLLIQHNEVTIVRGVAIWNKQVVSREVGEHVGTLRQEPGRRAAWPGVHDGVVLC